MFERIGSRVKATRYCTGNLLVLGLSLMMPSTGTAAASPEECRRIAIQGEALAGNEWRHPIGQGWVFRLVPIKAGTRDYSGWDLVVDRAGGAGFPDALLLATPPYDSINQREVGTTFGVRAQDAIGWNPRSFRFLNNPAVLRRAQTLYFETRSSPDKNPRGPDGAHLAQASDPAHDVNSALGSLMDDVATHSSAGQFRILDARLTPGTANALPYAQNWALQQRNTPHTITPTTSPTPYGKLDALRFEITLWLPSNWKTPKTQQAVPSACE